MIKADRSTLFLTVLGEHKGILFKVANAYCKSPEDRKDLVQEIIFQLWKSFDNYNNNFKYSTWIYRISLNVAITFYRKEHRRQKMNATFPDGIDIYEPQAVDGTGTDADLRYLQQVVAGLGDLDKALILLYFEEKSYKEIAFIIGITETNVATKISRIKGVIKQKFSQLKKENDGK